MKASTKWIRGARSAGAFLAVPTPYYDASQRKGFIYTGLIHATEELGKDKKITGNWDLNSEVGSTVEVTEEEDSAEGFWTRIEKLEGCRIDSRPDESKEKDKKTYLKWLVLCSMQKYLGADVALIQTRDLFDLFQGATRDYKYSNRATGGSSDSTDSKTSNKMGIADWKGDLVTLLHVPGKALRKRSINQILLTPPKNRAWLRCQSNEGTLETLGIRKTKDGEATSMNYSSKTTNSTRLQLPTT